MLSISEKILLLRNQGLKVAEILDKIGISRQFLSQITNGKSKMPFDKMKNLDALVESKCKVEKPVEVQNFERIQNSTSNPSFERIRNVLYEPVSLNDILDEMHSLHRRISDIEKLLIQLLAK